MLLTFLSTVENFHVQTTAMRSYKMMMIEEEVQRKCVQLGVKDGIIQLMKKVV